MKKFSNKLKVLVVTITALLLVILSSVTTLLIVNITNDESIIPSPIIFPATIKGRVFDDYGNMITSGIVIESEDGSRTRVNTNVLSGYTLKLSEGTYIFHFTRGMQYSIVQKTLTVENFKTYNIEDIRLVRLIDPSDFGFYAGDLHQHSNYSDGADNAWEVALSNINNGLYFGFLSDHNSAGGLAEWMQANHLVTNIKPDGTLEYFNAFLAVEITTIYGHYQSIGAGVVVPEWDIELDKGEVPVDEVVTIAREIIRNGGIAQVNHPYSYGEMGFTFWDILDEFQTIEIYNGKYQPNRDENLEAKNKWFELLNEGRYFPATSGSDNHSIASNYSTAYLPSNPTEADLYRDMYLKMGLYSGVPSYYAYIEGEITLGKIMQAILNGNAFMTNGILLFADVQSAIYGETHVLNSDTSIDLNLTAFGREGIQTINVIVNGVIVQEIILDGAINYSDIIEVENLSPGDWIVLEAVGDWARYAITNPIFMA